MEIGKIYIHKVILFSDLPLIFAFLLRITGSVRFSGLKTLFEFSKNRSYVEPITTSGHMCDKQPSFLVISLLFQSLIKGHKYPPKIPKKRVQFLFLFCFNKEKMIHTHMNIYTLSHMDKPPQSYIYVCTVCMLHTQGTHTSGYKHFMCCFLNCINFLCSKWRRSSAEVAHLHYKTLYIYHLNRRLHYYHNKDLHDSNTTFNEFIKCEYFKEE